MGVRICSPQKTRLLIYLLSFSVCCFSFINMMFVSLHRDNEAVLQTVKGYKPQIEGQLLRILLHGPVGAGKSSLINSVQSVLLGRIYRQALVDNTSGDSFTKEVRK